MAKDRYYTLYYMLYYMLLLVSSCFARLQFGGLCLRLFDDLLGPKAARDQQMQRRRVAVDAAHLQRRLNDTT